MTTDTTNLKKTALNKIMTDMGGKMTDFHGWHLPIEFSGIISEHKSVRNTCGIFDVSHMGNIFVEGRDAYQLVQKVNTNNVKSECGRGVYSHIVNENGGIIDDVISFCINENKFYIVVNATTTQKDFDWFKKNASGLNVKITNASADFQMFALQGPKSLALMKEICPDALKLARFYLLKTKILDFDCIVTRTGYTGEDGFEIACNEKAIISIFETLMDKGKKYGIAPCGLGARDTLRLEAGYLLYGQDIDENHTPYDANYGWVVKPNKPIDFIGKKALLEQKNRGIKTKLAGFVLTDRAIARQNYAVYKDDEKISTLTSATFSPTLGKSIGMGYAPPDLKESEQVKVLIHSRYFNAQVTKMPFYQNKV